MLNKEFVVFFFLFFLLLYHHFNVLDFNENFTVFSLAIVQSARSYRDRWKRMKSARR